MNIYVQIYSVYIYRDIQRIEEVIIVAMVLKGEPLLVVKFNSYLPSLNSRHFKIILVLRLFKDPQGPWFLFLT